MSLSKSSYVPIFSERQQRILGILPLFTAPFALVGSSLIIYCILVDRGTKLKSVYQRLMLGLSTYDVIASMGILFLGPWAVPVSASEFVVGAKGTVATCEASGFLLNYLFGSMLYTFFLAIYFVCHIRFEWQQSTIARLVEFPAHILAIALPNLFGVWALVDGDFNPLEILPGFCYYTMYPPHCHDDPQVPCERGIEASTDETIPAVIVFATIITCMALIISKVRSTETRVMQYSSERDLVLTRESVVQASLYIVAFFTTFFPVVLVEMLYHYRRHWYFVIFAAMTKFLVPLQGFFNAFIYLQKQPRELFRDEGSLAFLSRFRDVLRSDYFRTNSANPSESSNLERSVPLDAPSDKCHLHI